MIYKKEIQFLEQNQAQAYLLVLVKQLMIKDNFFKYFMRIYYK
uniref:Uncharacterized protein ycf18 n=1 Tax=Porphyridium sordidum TaxID=28024 RepID=A0A1C9CDZ3_PORSO|nr:phycobilisome degradation protein [Porphyridium sordidum]AOM66610.1 phycobilisome degradation protein [Porphyridium sordidum]